MVWVPSLQLILVRTPSIDMRGSRGERLPGDDLRRLGAHGQTTEATAFVAGDEGDRIAVTSDRIDLAVTGKSWPPTDRW